MQKKLDSLYRKLVSQKESLLRGRLPMPLEHDIIPLLISETENLSRLDPIVVRKIDLLSREISGLLAAHMTGRQMRSMSLAGSKQKSGFDAGEGYAVAPLLNCRV